MYSSSLDLVYLGIGAVILRFLMAKKVIDKFYLLRGIEDACNHNSSVHITSISISSLLKDG